MPTLLCTLGQTRELCLAELSVVAERFGLSQPELLAEHTAMITVPTSLDVKHLQDVLGGTSKIAELLDRTPLAKEEAVTARILDYLLELRPKRFALAEFGRDHLEPLDAVALKSELAKAGIKANYKETPRYGGNAGLLKSGSVLELQVIQTATELIYAKTLTVQNVDLWSLRDVAKPERDRKRGMLPPKIAHMMINLAIGADQPTHHVLLDPFCGTGTVMIEGAYMDIPHVMGSDIDALAIQQSKKNLEWWAERQVEPFTYEVLGKPVEKLEKHDFSQPPTIIVTEPFLGKLTPNPEQIPRVLDGLERLYKGTLRSFARILPAGGRVVIIFPSFQTSKRPQTVSRILETLPSFGFEYVAGPFRGGRPSAVTQREIHVLRKV